MNIGIFIGIAALVASVGIVAVLVSGIVSSVRLRRLQVATQPRTLVVAERIDHTDHLFTLRLRHRYFFAFTKLQSGAIS
ncbi:MAG: hypothetical protein U5L45_11810 [Saprospiraceae bacterium]|nr:hypothetical protein [Saprospiraceae bacterium]